MSAIVKRNKVKAAKKVVPVKDKETVVSQEHKHKKENRNKLTQELRKSGAIKCKRRGVVYIKPLPHGFHEKQLRKYLNQVGSITHLRLVRSKETLNSKGYTLIEFRYPEVAEIVADAMNNCMMFKNVIETVFIPSDETKFDFFKHGLIKTTKNGKTVLTSTSIEAEESLVESNNRLMTRSAQIVVSKINIANANLAYGIDYEDSSENEDDDMASGYKDDDMASGDEDEDDDIASGDETFDPMKMDVDSDHSVEDFECDTDASDDGEDDDGIKKKLETAVSKARQASDKLNKTDLTKQKANEASKPQIVKPAPTPVEKKRAKVAEKPAPVAAVEKKFPANAAPKEKKAAKKEQRPVAVVSPVVVKPKGRPSKKPAPVAAVEKKFPANAAPKEKKAAKKEQRPVAVVSPVVVKPKRRPAKKPAPAVVESPVQTKTMRFQKTSAAIEKKKLAAKVGKANRSR